MTRTRKSDVMRALGAINKLDLKEEKLQEQTFMTLRKLLMPILKVYLKEKRVKYIKNGIDISDPDIAVVIDADINNTASILIRWWMTSMCECADTITYHVGIGSGAHWSVPLNIYLFPADAGANCMLNIWERMRDNLTKAIVGSPLTIENAYEILKLLYKELPRKLAIGNGLCVRFIKGTRYLSYAPYEGGHHLYTPQVTIFLARE